MHEKLIDKGPVHTAPGFSFEHFESLASTNPEALARARDDGLSQHWIVADEQRAGRARRGRNWTSEKGNLFASVVVRFAQEPQRLMQLPFVAALSLMEAVELACGAHGLIELKWPNDLLVEGAKISGILLESEPAEQAGQVNVVCGFGVNCLHHPDIAMYPTVSLAGLGYRVAPQDLFLQLAARFAAWIEIWQGPGGFDEVRRRWLARAAGRGKMLTVRLPNEEFTGVFVDLDAFGRLILALDNGKERLVSAGDVFFPNLR
ncbi:biotin--[acetyl-CoA-carboxylase] ligase [Polycladidibacter hongkongensis]|uniref:biotin--[acetyl-CoA-carboxylase] ligase n=1 Tax=Polycladidibacter hongkongensis TaxID=1647556 RepID=UPI0008361017|nr:biotin--[acetyl-CoA-carboxylase] ligase [Pseudovibrio hongkongensis]